MYLAQYSNLFLSSLLLDKGCQIAEEILDFWVPNAHS